MKFFVLVLITLACFNSTAQSKCRKMKHYWEADRHVFALGSGMYHRGLLEASYHFIPVTSEHVFFSSGVGYGIGWNPFGEHANHFIFSTSTLAGGFTDRNDHKYYLGLTLDYQYIDYHIGELDENNYYYSYPFTLQRWMPYLSFTTIQKPLYVQFRFSALFLTSRPNEVDYFVETGSFGLSAGWNF